MNHSPSVVAPDQKAFRRALSRLPTSVVVVTAMHADRPIGMVVGTFTSVSLEPPLVGYLGALGSSTASLLRAADQVSCSVLHESDLDVVKAFARPPASRFDGVAWELDTEFQVPVLTRAPLTVFARPVGATDAGDHVFVVHDVLALRTAGPARPLVFCGGRLSRMDPGHIVDSDFWQLGWEDL
ncbi:flavin reductase family protein [Streptomyces sp. 4F14]|uniref:flavin reductase family protein n=1 Tax=Streptomyces sp. 4F14 TaxID=3394380 RepID=UPI003A8B1C57